jgi:hypothetical protein
MRKNRSRADADIPVLTDAIAVAPAASPLFAPTVVPAAREAGPVAFASSDTPPVATVESANESMLSTNAPPTDAPSAEVPLLTDAVGDMLADFESLPPQPAARRGSMEGDPSDWLVMDTIDPSTHSITGRGPDTLAVVPPMTLKAAGSAATPPPMGSQLREQRAAEPSPPTLALVTERPTEEASAAAPVQSSEASAPALQSPQQRDPAAAVRSPPESASAASAAAPEESVPVTKAQSSEERAGAAPLPDPDQGSALETAPTAEESIAAPTAHSSGERLPGTADEELWRTLAEQISMQVLQRLDLFTDSGLKAQLASRLQPIVERASAELVGEITEQVGRLVRTYVSEAIEREIAQWKRDQH